jgi:histidyl-tRNA synthetase
MNYADKQGFPYVAFLGEDEVASGTVSIKDMATGVQSTVTTAQAVDAIGNDLAERTACVDPILDRGV